MEWLQKFVFMVCVFEGWGTFTLFVHPLIASILGMVGSSFNTKKIIFFFYNLQLYFLFSESMNFYFYFYFG